MNTNDPQQPYVVSNEAFSTGEGIARAILLDHGFSKAQHIIAGMRNAFKEEALSFIHDQHRSKDELDAAHSILVQVGSFLNEITEPIDNPVKP